MCYGDNGDNMRMKIIYNNLYFFLEMLRKITEKQGVQLQNEIYLFHSWLE